MLRRHRPLLLNWFHAHGTLSSGAVEGFNNKAKLTMRRADGFRTFRAFELALYHTLGDLPQPQATHRFLEEAYFETKSLRGLREMKQVSPTARIRHGCSCST